MDFDKTFDTDRSDHIRESNYKSLMGKDFNKLDSKSFLSKANDNKKELGPTIEK